MANGDIPVTIKGNLVADPELRFTPNGVAVTNFRVASTTRNFDRESGGWKDGDTTFLTCVVWREQAEHVAETLTRGTRVVVEGKLKQRSYTTREGEPRTVTELQVDEVGPSLLYATAKVTKVTRTGTGVRGGGQSTVSAGSWVPSEPVAA